LFIEFPIGTRIQCLAHDWLVHPDSRVLLAGSGETLVHELSLGEAHPPLAGLVGLRVEDSLGQSQPGLLAKLLQEASHRVCSTNGKGHFV